MGEFKGMSIPPYNGYTWAWGHMVAWAYGVGVAHDNDSYVWAKLDVQSWSLEWDKKPTRLLK